MEQIKVDIIPGRAIPVCHASQFDDGRVIRVNLTNNYSSDYVLDGTEEVTVNVRKVDGNLVVKQCDVVTGRSYVDVVTTEQMTACHGSNLADLTIKKSGTTIGTMNFILEVEKDPLEDGVVSASEIYNLEMQIREINEQVLPGQVAEQLATMYDGSDVLFDTTPTENHGVPYTVTSAGIKAKFDGLDLSPDSLNNVDLDPEINDGDALVYNATTDKWINAEAGKKTLEELNDVDLSTPPSDKQVLVYDDTEEKWIAGDGSRVWEGTQAEYNALTEIDPDVTYFITDGSAIDLTLGGLQDTNISNPSSGQSLIYNGSKWVNKGVEDVTSQITWNETVVDVGTGAYKFGNMVFITYQGEHKTHAALDVLFVVPSGLRPLKNCRVPFTVNAVAYGNLVINATGNCAINQISDDTQTGRIYFSVTYLIA